MFHDVDILQRMHRTTAGVRKPIPYRTLKRCSRSDSDNARIETYGALQLVD